jgi:hypothetical protein
VGFNINNQTGGVVNNVEGNQYIRGNQRGQLVQLDTVREAFQELEHGVASIGLEDSKLAAMSVYLRDINAEISRGHPEPKRVVDPLRKITEIASAAGALASLAGPIQSFMAWLGPLGQPIAKLLTGT